MRKKGERKTENLLIASTEASAYFAKRIADQLADTDGLGIDRKTFGGGEKYLRFDIADRNALLGKDVVFAGPTHTDDNLLELYRIGCALAQYGVRRRIFVIPFLGYSTMERAVRSGEVVAAKTNARLLSSIPNSGLGNTFLFMDLHVQGLLYYFEGDCLRTELYAESVFISAIKQLGLENMMFASADLGRPQWIQTFARKFGTSLAFVQKEHVDETTEVTAVIGDVRGKNVIIYDDMTRSGASAINAAEAYMEAGASTVYLVLSHFAVNDVGVIDMLQSSCIQKIITTNTHPMSQKIPGYIKFEVLDVTPIFVNAIYDIFNN